MATTLDKAPTRPGRTDPADLMRHATYTQPGELGVLAWSPLTSVNIDCPIFYITGDAPDDLGLIITPSGGVRVAAIYGHRWNRSLADRDVASAVDRLEPDINDLPYETRYCVSP